jgi:hypothetical protein
MDRPFLLPREAYVSDNGDYFYAVVDKDDGKRYLNFAGRKWDKNTKTGEDKNLIKKCTIEELLDHIEETWSDYYDSLPENVKETIKEKFVPKRSQHLPPETILEFNDLPI